MYGTTVEGPTVYSEAFDFGASGPYTEEIYDNTEQTLTSQDVNTSLLPPSQSPLGVSSGTNNVHFTSNQTQANHVTHNDTFGGKRQQPTDINVNRPPMLQNERNSQTPVVSVLSIEQQQEKDYSSMQSGRRRKPIMQNNQNVPVYPSNGFVNPFVSFNPQHPPPSLFGPHPPPPHSVFNNGFGFPDYRRFNGYIEGRYNNNRTRRRNYDHSSRSSLRTDSNSSASVVDEDKTVRTAVNTPPPAPYSPITHHQFKSLGYTKSFNNNNYKKHNNNNTNDDNMNYYCYNKSESIMTNDLTKTKNNSPPINNNNNVIINDKSRKPESLQQSSDSQVHLSTTTNQSSYVPTAATTQPQARRNKRSLRRSGAGGGVNEIGAGDAPLPDDVAGEVCKKMDSLKL